MQVDCLYNAKHKKKIKKDIEINTSNTTPKESQKLYTGEIAEHNTQTHYLQRIYKNWLISVEYNQNNPFSVIS